MRCVHSQLSRVKRCHAQAVVEFAIVLPVLLLLMLGLINLGVMINAQIILTQAVWEGARAGATLDPEIEDGDAHIRGAVQAAMSGLTNPDSVLIDISPSGDERDAMGWPKPRGEPLQVTLEYPLGLTLPFPVTLKLGAQATSRIEYSNPP
ncbi:MAG: hypothetical protein GTO14_18860 [Anaerolineales bacterium]|nr:hypothetical protein [Anaerolineales bacterium]